MEVLAAEKVAREDVEQRLAQTEAKAVTLAGEVTDLRNSQQRFDISTRRASLVVHNVPRSPGVDAGDALQQVCTCAGLQPLTYSEAVRLGKPPEAGGGGEVRPRPVLVTPSVGHLGRRGRPVHGPAAVLSRAVRRGLG